MTGGANWQGGAVDAETGVLYVASVTNPTVAGLTSDPDRSTMDYVGGGGRRRREAAAPQGCGELGPLGLGEPSEPVIDLAERHGAVHLGLPGTQEVQVRSMKDEDPHGSSSYSSSRRSCKRLETR